MKTNHQNQKLNHKWVGSKYWAFNLLEIFLVFLFIFFMFQLHELKRKIKYKKNFLWKLTRASIARSYWKGWKISKSWIKIFSIWVSWINHKMSINYMMLKRQQVPAVLTLLIVTILPPHPSQRFNRSHHSIRFSELKIYHLGRADVVRFKNRSSINHTP